MNLFAWQWSLYPNNHTDRRNLIIHIATVPFFIAATVALVAGPITARWWLAPIGLGVMALVMALQGRGHKLEPEPPVPFKGPGDVVRRILAEQLVTFPRYVLTGGFAKAWRRTR